MNILMIGFDKTLISSETQQEGDSLIRHIKYINALREKIPDSKLYILTQVDSSAQQITQAHGELIVTSVPSRRAFFLPNAFLVFRRRLKDVKFDLITTQTPFDDGVLGILLAKIHRIPLLVHMHSSFIDYPLHIVQRPVIYRLFNFVAKIVLRYADKIRVVSQGEMKRLIPKFPWMQGKITCLPPLINFSIFERRISQREIEDVNRHLSALIGNNDPFFLFVGRLSREKNIPFLFEAFQILKAKGCSANLIIIGGGPEQVRLKQAAVHLEIQDRVLWLGRIEIEKLRGWYSTAIATILPSFQEGFGKVIAEAYMLETPVLTTPFVSANELVVIGKTGFIVPFDDTTQLAERMIFLLQNQEMRLEMGIRGRSFILDYLPPESEYLDSLTSLWISLVPEQALRIRTETHHSSD